MPGGYRTARTPAALAVILSLAAALPAGAWSGDGHRAVAQVAGELISDEAAAEVARLLGGTPVAQAATWADRARDQPAWEWSWRLHFVNVPDDARILVRDRDCPSLGCPSAPADGPARCCVVGALEHYLEVLADDRRDDSTRATALRFVLHFAGDLHQPLHVSRARDRGGNEIEVTFFGEPMDLHEVWDRAILRRREDRLWSGADWRSRAARLRSGLAGSPLEEWRLGEPWEWAQESLTLALEVAYDVGPSPHRLGREYQDRAWPIVETRLRQAAVRLARLLDSALGGR